MSALRRAAVGTLAAVLTLALAGPHLGGAGTTAAAPAEARGTDLALAATTTNPPTPGNFTGLGFDQCNAPSQKAMDVWRKSSPYEAVGIYISGNSRFCRAQPNLTPTWVTTQLANGWRLLPITLGPQSTCVGRFPRYGATIDPTIKNKSTDGYRPAFKQGKREAKSAVAAATALGIVPTSTLWYDLEGWSNYRDATCRESALSFLSGWTKKIHDLDYVSGVYSSAGSGIRILDDARFQARPDVVLPDRLWIARWDGKANVDPNDARNTYLRADGWLPGNRMKQYLGGHDETWGGVTINIDSNYLELGTPATAVPPSRCATLSTYKKITPRKHKTKQVKTLKCLLSEKSLYEGKMSKKYNKKLRNGIHGWQDRAGQRVKSKWTRKNWDSLLADARRS